MFKLADISLFERLQNQANAGFIAEMSVFNSEFVSIYNALSTHEYGKMAAQKFWPLFKRYMALMEELHQEPEKVNAVYDLIPKYLGHVVPKMMFDDDFDFKPADLEAALWSAIFELKQLSGSLKLRDDDTRQAGWLTRDAGATWWRGNQSIYGDAIRVATKVLEDLQDPRNNPNIIGDGEFQFLRDSELQTPKQFTVEYGLSPNDKKMRSMSIEPKLAYDGD